MRAEEDVLRVLQDHPEGLTRQALQRLARRPKDEPWAVRRVLKALEAKGLLQAFGKTRSRRYFPVLDGTIPVLAVASPPPASWAFSSDYSEVVLLVTRPLHQRTPCSYERSFLDAYRPNSTFYLREQDRLRLREVGVTPDANQPAGTWARHIIERLLIDLSWNSSRLEGNTYSLLDTERLFRDRAAAEGRQVLETQMLLNHKQAIEFLVGEAATLKLEPRTLRTLHGMLAENLLSDPADEGRLRRATVRIHDSTFLPLDVPQRIEEAFAQVLATAAAIDDPFEQSFFLLVHLPYLQPFADVNKRTSRLAANLPLLQRNLQPLSFVDVPREAYTLATLGVYELRRVEALRDVYVWAYQRSAERYRAIVKSLGEPDAFRLRYRDALREVVRTVVQELPAPEALEPRVAALAELHAPEADRPRFRAVALQELTNLNEGTFHRYRLRPAEFSRWTARG
jgi:Fic family protein